ncbi:MAG: Rpn family recombination-promoting nuclease/putative transposase [Lachnospiraceae bacterium]|nr:Rpn family recombination-promoting nuclease/putative transposase [Lachnospiraceae bacterium]
MNNNQQNTFQNATGKIDYTLMNDYMFRAVMQKNKNVLKELICALLHLNPRHVKSVALLNPIELGDSFNAKTFVLDIKVMLDNAAVINLEMQVLQQSFWNDRALSYLCDIFTNLEKGDDYSHIKPAYHIGIVDFTPFPDYPEFYTMNKMMNVKKHYIYNDNFTLNVLDLNQIELATEEDKAYKIDYWAKLFKAKTWEDLKMLAQKDDIFEETSEEIYNLNQDDVARYWCQMREEGERILRTYKSLMKEKDAIIAEKDSSLAEKDSMIAMLQAKLAEYEK